MIRVNRQYDIEWRPGMTVQDLLEELRFTFRMIAVKVNGQVVLRADYATTPVPDGAQVEAIHLVSGG
jgi:sulfur carrier protein